MEGAVLVRHTYFYAGEKMNRKRGQLRAMITIVVIWS